MRTKQTAIVAHAEIAGDQEGGDIELGARPDTHQQGGDGEAQQAGFAVDEDQAGKGRHQQGQRGDARCPQPVDQIAHQQTPENQRNAEAAEHLSGL